jgi:hypothetical protein
MLTRLIAQINDQHNPKYTFQDRRLTVATFDEVVGQTLADYSTDAKSMAALIGVLTKNLNIAIDLLQNPRETSMKTVLDMLVERYTKRLSLPQANINYIAPENLEKQITEDFGEASELIQPVLERLRSKNGPVATQDRPVGGT